MKKKCQQPKDNFRQGDLFLFLTTEDTVPELHKRTHQRGDIKKSWSSILKKAQGTEINVQVVDRSRAR